MEVDRFFDELLTSADNFAACFDVKTGDVEDAPAPHALNKFDVLEKGGGVYIKGKEADIKGGKRTVNIKTTPSGQERVVIVGGYVTGEITHVQRADIFAVAVVPSVHSSNSANITLKAISQSSPPKAKAFQSIEPSSQKHSSQTNPNYISILPNGTPTAR